ncbi:MAG: TMEM175 family protein [Pseudomonadota bacterium]
MAIIDPESRKRLDQFVDAAFGFAVTLLVIAGAQPETLDDLRAALLNIPSSAAAFVLIVLFWQAHKIYGRLAPARGTADTLLVLAVVFMVLVYVFPLKLLTQALFYWISGGALPGRQIIDSFGDLATLYQVYGLGFAALSGLYAVLFARAYGQAGDADGADDIRSWRDAWMICAASGLASALLALLPLKGIPWLPPLTYSLIPVMISVRERIAGRGRRREQDRDGVPASGEAQAPPATQG